MKCKYKWIVWVGGCDDYYVNYEDAKKAYDQWIEDGYDEVQLEENQWIYSLEKKRTLYGGTQDEEEEIELTYNQEHKEEQKEMEEEWKLTTLKLLLNQNVVKKI